MKLVLPIVILILTTIVLLCYFFNIWFFLSICVILLYKLILRFLKKKEPTKLNILEYGQKNIKRYDK